MFVVTDRGVGTRAAGVRTTRAPDGVLKDQGHDKAIDICFR
jgi:hypothetical protein